MNAPGEGPVASPASAIVRLTFPIRLLGELGFDAGQRYWRMQHGPIIRRHAEAMGVLRYLQVHRIESDLEAALRASRGTAVEAYDGHAEIWFDAGNPPATAAARRGGSAAVEDERRFIDFRRSSLFHGKELVIFDRPRRVGEDPHTSTVRSSRRMLRVGLAWPGSSEPLCAAG